MADLPALRLYAEIAQLVEQRYRKPQVVGSSPSFGSSIWKAWQLVRNEQVGNLLAAGRFNSASWLLSSLNFNNSKRNIVLTSSLISEATP